jgi:hypothetical protein
VLIMGMIKSLRIGNTVTEIGIIHGCLFNYRFCL